MTFAPRSLVLNAYQGQREALRFIVKLKAPLAQPPAWMTRDAEINDPQKVTSGYLTVYSSARQTAEKDTIYLRTDLSDKLAVGTHEGVLTVRMCTPTVLDCKVGSGPLIDIPYRVTVRPAENLTTLSPIAGLADWESDQANRGGSGFVPIDVDPAKLIQRYRRPSPAPLRYTGEIRTVSGNAVLGVAGSGSQAVHAISEATGTLAWKRDGVVVAAGGGSVYVAAANGTSMVGLDGASGTQHSTYTPVERGVIQGDILYTANSRVDLRSGKVTAVWAKGFLVGRVREGTSTMVGGRWFVVGLDIDGRAVLQEIDKATAEIVSNADLSAFPGLLFAEHLRLARCSDNALVIAAIGQVISYDLSTRSVKWSVSDRLGYGMACDNESLYVSVGRSIEQRSLSDGTLQGTWENLENPPAGSYVLEDFASNIVLTNNLVFFSVGERIFALERATRKLVWSEYFGAARLAISRNGVLIGRNQEEVRAFNLR